jgi:DNA-binding response OmpR family regulator
LHILVVDESADSAHALAVQLRRAGHVPDVARSSQAAIEAACASPPDVVLVDEGMGGENHFAMAHELLSILPRRPVLIALLEFNLDDDRQRLLSAGFDYSLVKPVDIRRLLAAVQIGAACTRDDPVEAAGLA